MPDTDLVLSHALVVTMDDGYRVYRDGAVAVKGERIAAVGTTDEVLQACPANDVFDCHGQALIPGLINAHTHAPMVLLRGMADDLRLDVWLMGYMMPVEREFVTPDFCRLGTLMACAEMIRSGITCFADMYYFEEAVAEAVAQVGMRAVCSQSVLKYPTPDAASYEDSLAYASIFIERWKDHPLVVPSIAPHAAYTCPPEVLQACAQLAVRFDVPLHIHISETREEVEEWRELYDMPIVPWVKKQGLLEAKVLAAHCVHVDDGEIHTLQHAGAGVAHNPSSNLKLASGFAPVVDMLEAGLAVGIGTDGAASNNDLDLFEEMRLASFIAKAATGDPTALPARQTFAMATCLGAKALHIGHLTGSLEPGKRADLALVDVHSLHNLPHFNRDPNAVYSRLVYATKSTDVTDVMVNGRWLMRGQTLLTVEEAPLLRAAGEYATRIDAFLIEREHSILSKLVAIEGAEQEESYEVQIKVRLEQPEPVIRALEGNQLQVVRKAHYLEYDTYFFFDDPAQGRLRYREDEFVDADGEVYNVRYRLTLTGPARQYEHSVPLSRSRFIAPATHSLRFYREYFKPKGEIEVNKDRRRWLARYKDKEFFVNLDQIRKPTLGHAYLEVKSRTWSRSDAEEKSGMILELLQVLGAEGAAVVAEEYPDLVQG
jgi:5-methylthioadenosine/S-adenosylhomocysteine deaminase